MTTLHSMLLFTRARKLFRVRVNRIEREQLAEGGNEETIGDCRQLHTRFGIVFCTGYLDERSKYDELARTCLPQGTHITSPWDVHFTPK